jgi:hypothetical protein
MRAIRMDRDRFNELGLTTLAGRRHQEDMMQRREGAVAYLPTKFQSQYL